MHLVSIGTCLLLSLLFSLSSCIKIVLIVDKSNLNPLYGAVEAISGRSSNNIAIGRAVNLIPLVVSNTTDLCSALIKFNSTRDALIIISTAVDFKCLLDIPVIQTVERSEVESRTQPNWISFIDPVTTIKLIVNDLESGEKDICFATVLFDGTIGELLVLLNSS